MNKIENLKPAAENLSTVKSSSEERYLLASISRRTSVAALTSLGLIPFAGSIKDPVAWGSLILCCANIAYYLYAKELKR